MSLEKRNEFSSHNYYMELRENEWDAEKSNSPSRIWSVISESK